MLWVLVAWEPRAVVGHSNKRRRYFTRRCDQTHLRSRKFPNVVICEVTQNLGCDDLHAAAAENSVESPNASRLPCPGSRGTRANSPRLPPGTVIAVVSARDCTPISGRLGDQRRPSRFFSSASASTPAATPASAAPSGTSGPPSLRCRLREEHTSQQVDHLQGIGLAQHSHCTHHLTL